MSMCRRWLGMLVVVAMLLVVAMAGVTRTFQCVCDPTECEALEPSGCPGLGSVIWDPCRCCKICARTLGEECGGFKGTCEDGLDCYDGNCAPIT